MRFPILTALATAATLAFTAMPAHALLIDDFNGGDDSVVSVLSPGPSTTAYAPALGGGRTLEILSGASGATSLAVAGGLLNHGQSPVSGGSSKVTWAPIGVDLTEAGAADGIRLQIVFIDVGNVDLTFDVVDGAANTSSLTLTNLVAGTHQFFFTDFSAGADFTNVDNLMLTITAAANSDLQLDLLDSIDVVVSEPAVMALAGVGLIGLAIARRRV